MQKILIILALTSLFLIAGCGGGSETTEADAAKTEGAQAIEDAKEVAATHDCDGGCGMKNVAVAQLTEVDGKFYCAGCKDKAKEEDHSGHNH